MIRRHWIGLLAVLLALGCGGTDDNGEGTGGDGGAAAMGGDGGATGGSGAGGSVAIECFDEPALAGDLGGSCRGDTSECNGELGCLGETVVEVGGPSDPIIDNPAGEDVAIEATIWPDDYCTRPVTGICSLEEAAACNDVCGACTPFLEDLDICLRQCRAAAADNSACRDGYECDLLFEVCNSGCATDDECRVSRPDTDGNGEIEVYDAESMTGDRLVYRADSNAFCNLDTYRCETPGAPGAEAGIECEQDEQCEANGTCFSEVGFNFPLGYCSKRRCDLAGNDCAGEGVCANLGGAPVCAAPCQVGAGSTPGDESTYLGNTQGCREDYTCFWGGFPDDPSGVCVPGLYNDVTDNNVGESCDDSETCYSPFGQGGCVNEEVACGLLGAPPGEACPAGFGCTVFDCGVPGMPTDVCGTDAECVALPSGLTLCLETCATADDCLSDAACFELDPDEGVSICFPLCLTDEECRDGEICSEDGECTPAP
ncbi:MAG: hypothetical protein AAF500_10225 [Myxococcota bacterium]